MRVLKFFRGPGGTDAVGKMKKYAPPYQKFYLWKLCELWYGALSRAENNRLQQCYSNVPDTKVKKLKHYNKRNAGISSEFCKTL